MVMVPLVQLHIGMGFLSKVYTLGACARLVDLTIIVNIFCCLLVVPCIRLCRK